MDQSRKNSSGSGDTRDVRTGQGELPKGDTMGAAMNSSSASDAGPLPDIDDPVLAGDPTALPSDYSMEDINEGQTPLDDEMEMLVDPSIGAERYSTNPDVLDLSDEYLSEGEEPTFAQDPGTTDIIQVIEEGETYFPPTDPPNTRGYDNAEVMGGFAGTSLEEPSEPQDDPLRLGGDDEIAERVRYALAADSYTTDLNIEVEVNNGTVYLHGTVASLDDIEQAEQVAGSVPGVEEVQEDMEIV